MKQLQQMLLIIQPEYSVTGNQPVLINMNIRAFTVLILLALPVSISHALSESEKYQHQRHVYPPVFFKSNISYYPIKQKLASYNAFEALSPREHSSPITIIAITGHRQTSDIATLTSQTLSASTLGAIPVLSKGVYRITYIVFIHGEVFTQYKYEMTTEELKSLWVASSDSKTPEEILFLEHSVDYFLHELAANNELINLFNEYYLYASDN